MSVSILNFSDSPLISYFPRKIVPIFLKAKSVKSNNIQINAFALLSFRCALQIAYFLG